MPFTYLDKEPIQQKRKFTYLDQSRQVNDVPESEFQPKNIALETAKGTAKTIGQSAGNLVKGAYQAVRHPVDTANALADVATGGIQHLVLDKNINTPEKQAASGVAQFYKNRYGSLDNIADTVANDPFGFVADVGGMAGVAGAGMRTGGRLLGNEAMMKAGTFPMAKQITNQAIKSVGQSAGKIGKTVAETTSKMKQKKMDKLSTQATEEYRTMLRPNAGEIRNVEIRKGRKIDDYYQLAAEEQLPITQTADKKLDTLTAREKLKPRQEQLHEVINQELGGDNSKQFDLIKIANQAKNELRKTIKNDTEYKNAAADVDEQILDAINTRGRILTGQELNNFKQGMWSVGYNQLKPTSQSTARKIGHIAKEAIEKGYPDSNIKQLNELSGKYATLNSLLENAQGRVVRGGRLGGYAARAIGAIAGSKLPVVGPLIGQAVGGKVADFIYAPERASAIASSKAVKSGMAGKSFKDTMNLPRKPPYTGTRALVPVPSKVEKAAPNFSQSKLKPQGEVLRSAGPEKVSPKAIVEVPSSAQDIKIPDFGIKGKKGTSSEIDAFVKQSTSDHVKALERELAILREKKNTLLDQGKEKEAGELVYGQISAVSEALRKSKIYVANTRRSKPLTPEQIKRNESVQAHWAKMLDDAKARGDDKMVKELNKRIVESIDKKLPKKRPNEK